MRYLIFVAFLASCGDGPKVALEDMARLSTVDLAEPAVADLAQPPPPPPVDMARPPACSAPLPGVYTDVLQFNYAPLSNPSQVASAQAITDTVIRNDGTLWRPSPAIPTPFGYHCDFTERSVDPVSCTAPCCGGQASSPTLYFDERGWMLVVSGVCQFQTTSAVMYSATIVDGAGTLVH